MKNLMKIVMALGLSLALMPTSAFAGAVTSVRASLQATKDDSGYPVVIESDRAWKVFEIKDTTDETQVTDEDSKTPTTGVLHKVCLESAPAIPGASDWAIIWDSTTATGASTASRRLLPPIVRVSGAQYCTDVIDAIFTRGLRGKNGVAVGGTYLYWRELGAKR